MHAVVVRVTINDSETAQKTLEKEVVPRASGRLPSSPDTGRGPKTEATAWR
jgi:hypothetical protein